MKERGGGGGRPEGPTRLYNIVSTVFAIAPFLYRVALASQVRRGSETNFAFYSNSHRGGTMRGTAVAMRRKRMRTRKKDDGEGGIHRTGTALRSLAV